MIKPKRNLNILFITKTKYQNFTYKQTNTLTCSNKKGIL
ncbi:Uncharacterised protein [Helicobacter muridarum]|uniref:Uncharacterized protein n=1 Tax=Helicobacter muridarum TaxID=216 RepID=A0A377PVQ0_9HELI|nr:Uncharacterised protein [Helicobacter muridarum]